MAAAKSTQVPTYTYAGMLGVDCKWGDLCHSATSLV